MEAPVQLVMSALARSGIRFMLGGSLASAFHGIPRSTNDIDIVADIREEHIQQFVSELEGAFYVDAESMREALQHRRSFNVIHFATGDKIDIFPVAETRHIEIELERSKPQDVTIAEGLNVRCPVATAEDTILAKLVWYRLGGEQSDRQWNDVRGIRAVQGDTLDQAYMQQWARELKVDDLLARLFSEDLLP
jgi:hypothetical protein